MLYNYMYFNKRTLSIAVTVECKFPTLKVEVYR